MDRKDQNYIKWGITIFASLAATIVFFFLLYRFADIRRFFHVILAALQPLVIGMAMAYVVCPVEMFLERSFHKFTRFARALAVLLTMVLVFLLIGLFLALVLPQLVQSVSELMTGLPHLVNAQMERLRNYTETDSQAAAEILRIVESVETYLADWIKTHMLSAVSTVSSSVISIGSALVNFVIAVIVAVYLLIDREHYLAQCRKLFFSVSRNKRWNDAVMDAVQQTDRIFSGFISGKLVDSLIVGVICFLGLSLLKMPYALLVSVIVGVTNIIPMFGPFIGMVPSAFLILLVSPVKCLIFLVFIAVLQQIDGNIIGPRILGNSTGLSALYVTVAMLLFGKLLGFLGMIVGVPLFATLYYIVKRLAEHSLRAQKLPVETSAYIVREQEETQRKKKKKTGS